jgi:hypothetical protein
VTGALAEIVDIDSLDDDLVEVDLRHTDAGNSIARVEAARTSSGCTSRVVVGAGSSGARVVVDAAQAPSWCSSSWCARVVRTRR